MAYLSGYQHDIFLSYAHVDNDLWKGLGRWVDEFHSALDTALAQQFGRKDRVDMWWDQRLPGNAPIQNAILKRCESTALLICITSPGYTQSEWCQREYDTFCGSNVPRYPPKHGEVFRVFNVRLRDVPEEFHNHAYKVLGEARGYYFYDRDSHSNGGRFPLWPGDLNFYNKVNDLALQIQELLSDMNPKRPVRYALALNTTIPVSREEAKEVVSELPGDINVIGRTNPNEIIVEGERDALESLRSQIEVSRAVKGHHGSNLAGLRPVGLDAILLQAEKSVVICGHTVHRFFSNPSIPRAFRALLARNPQVKLSVIMLNPESKAAQAHSAYYELESSGSPEEHYDGALKFLGEFFQSLHTDDLKAGFEVLLSSYMPHFRAVIVDDAKVYLYLYTYGEDVSDYPDFVYERKDPASGVPIGRSNPVLEKVITSVNRLKDAPEMVPYIRDGVLYEHWKQSKLAQWDRWSKEVRYRHRITHQYYVTHAHGFHERFGDEGGLEEYVKAHLNQLSGRVMVLGCGSGKEVAYLSEKVEGCSQVWGVDFSPEAINLARGNHPKLANRFTVADFYDLNYIKPDGLNSIAANAAFVHLFDRKDMSEMLVQIYQKLEPGGLCFIRNLYKEQNGNPLRDNAEYHRSENMFRDERWFVYYSRRELCQLAIGAGFVVDDQTTERIARNCDYLGRNLTDDEIELAKTKGFMHKDFDAFYERGFGVYWPTLLLKKPTA
jgi:SAM-dependent methyltransferase